MLDLIPKQKLLLGQFRLVSPLTPAECASRLRATMGNEKTSLFGSVGRDYFRIAWRYQPGMVHVRNSFRPYLFGRLQAFDGGTIVRCHFTLHPLILGLLIFILCMGGVAVVALQNWTFVVFPLLLLLAGFAVSWGERELIVFDVAAAINARPDGEERRAH